jgi:hypothetical protein
MISFCELNSSIPVNGGSTPKVLEVGSPEHVLRVAEHGIHSSRRGSPMEGIVDRSLNVDFVVYVGNGRDKATLSFRTLFGSQLQFHSFRSDIGNRKRCCKSELKVPVHTFKSSVINKFGFSGVWAHWTLVLRLDGQSHTLVGASTSGFNGLRVK